MASPYMRGPRTQGQPSGLFPGAPREVGQLAGFSSTEIHDVRQRLKEDVDIYLDMQGDNVIGLLLAVVIAGYLVYALVFPERL